MDLILLFALPLLLSNLIHHFVIIPLGLAAGLHRPLDHDWHWGDKRVFGENKTYRGLVAVPLFTGLATVAFAESFSIQTQTHPLWLGILIGSAYMLAELPNSFLKRRFDIPPGQKRGGLTGLAFRALDHTDSFLGAGVAIVWLESVPLSEIVWLGVVGVLCHIMVNLLIEVIGLRRCDHRKNNQPAPVAKGTDTLSSHGGE